MPIGPGMTIILIIAALLIFGPKRLPELGRAIGRTLNEFKKGAKEVMADDAEPETVQKSEQKSDDSNGNDRRLPE